MSFGYEIFILIFLISIIAACIDAIVGGGGLIIIPVLLSIGLPPATAIATNKVGGVAGSFSSSLYFIRKKEVRIREIPWMVLTTFIGSLLGGVLLLYFKSSTLERVIPILLIAFSIYFLFSPQVGASDGKNLLQKSQFTFYIAPLLGFYDGFFGPGTGAFMSISFVLLLGYNLIKATAHAKVLNFSGNLAAFLLFTFYGDIYWQLGLTMLVGQFIGGQLGARLVIKSGHKLIRIAIVALAFIISIKMLL